MPPQRAQPVAAPLATRHRRQHLDQPCQHRDAARRVLADHVEHRVDQPVIVDRRHHERRRAAAQGDPGRQMPGRHVAQRPSQPVQHGDRGVRIVDPRRQRPHRHLHQLAHGEFQVLVAAAIAAERGRVAHRLRRTLDRRPHQRDRRTRKHVVPRTHQQPQDRPPFRRPARQALRVEMLQIAASGIAHRDRVAGQRLPRLLRPVGRRRLRQRQPPDRRPHVAADQVDYRVDIDPARHVADEIHQHADADERQQQAHAERQVRHVRALALRPHAAQHHQRVGKRAEERAERELIAAIVGEVAQQPRPHLPRRQRQRRDGDREHRAGHADGRGRHRAEQRPRPGAAAIVEPRTVDERDRDRTRPVDPDQPYRQHDPRQHHQRRQQPERLRQEIEQLAQACVHGRSNRSPGRSV